MGFKEVVDVPAISLGGTNKKTGKANAKSIEGYFLRTREVPDKKKKTGIGYIHDFQTEKGLQPVWGKTDMDRKLQAVAPGTMVRVTWTGKVRPTPNGDMQLYLIEADDENTIEVASLPQEAESTGDEPEEGEYSDPETEETGESEPDAEEPQPDEQPVTRPKAPAKAAATPSAQRQAQVQALLKGGARKTA